MFHVKRLWARDELCCRAATLPGRRCSANRPRHPWTDLAPDPLAARRTRRSGRTPRGTGPTAHLPWADGPCRGTDRHPGTPPGRPRPVGQPGPPRHHRRRAVAPLPPSRTAAPGARRPLAGSRRLSGTRGPTCAPIMTGMFHVKHRLDAAPGLPVATLGPAPRTASPAATRGTLRRWTQPPSFGLNRAPSQTATARRRAGRGRHREHGATSRELTGEPNGQRCAPKATDVFVGSSRPTRSPAFPIRTHAGSGPARASSPAATRWPL